MSPTNEVLIRYIDRLEDDIRILNRRVQELTPNGSVSADIKKALHDASNIAGMSVKYKITDSDSVAVEWLSEAAEQLATWPRVKP